MPYNPNLGPDACYGIDDSGYCAGCGEHLDSGRCTCPICYDCEERFEPEEATKITVTHVVTGEPVEVSICPDCAEKREEAMREGNRIGKHLPCPKSDY